MIYVLGTRHTSGVLTARQVLTKERAGITITVETQNMPVTPRLPRVPPPGPQANTATLVVTISCFSFPRISIN